MFTLLELDPYGMVAGAAVLIGFGGFLGYMLGTQGSERRPWYKPPQHVEREPDPDETWPEFQQQQSMNAATIKKMELEVAALQSQIRVHADDQNRLQAARAFHELNVEKAKLEIDSLRLHIVELRKRIDDFGIGHD